MEEEVPKKAAEEEGANLSAEQKVKAIWQWADVEGAGALKEKELVNTPLHTPLDPPRPRPRPRPSRH